jgi:hypothetical protein
LRAICSNINPGERDVGTSPSTTSNLKPKTRWPGMPSADGPPKLTAGRGEAGIDLPDATTSPWDNLSVEIKTSGLLILIQCRQPHDPARGLLDRPVARMSVEISRRIARIGRVDLDA